MQKSKFKKSFWQAPLSVMGVALATSWAAPALASSNKSTQKSSRFQVRQDEETAPSVRQPVTSVGESSRIVSSPVVAPQAAQTTSPQTNSDTNAPGAIQSEAKANTNPPINAETTNSQAKAARPDFESLGGNKPLLDKAAALAPDRSVYTVEQRKVPRTMQFELWPEYVKMVGGDPYLETQNVGANLHFHFNPKVSLGVKYEYSMNSISSEGDELITRLGYVPDLDWPKHTVMGLVHYYPLYGKLNFFNMDTVQFDMYLSGGAGSISLKSGGSFVWTAGAGVGFWISKRVSVHAEWRYQRFDVVRSIGEDSLGLNAVGIGAGVLL